MRVNDEQIAYDGLDLPGTVTIGTRDADFRGDYASSTFGFRLMADVYEYGALTFAALAEGNNNAAADVNAALTNATIQALTPPVEITAASQSAASSTRDYYSVALLAGQTVIVKTQQDPNAPPEDPADPTGQLQAAGHNPAPL